MKLIIVSDVHGSEIAAVKAVKLFYKQKCDYLLLLGDVLYHGPRNPLPDSHNPKAVAEIFNSINDRIIAVRGNCDAEIDQKLLDFPCMADYALVVDGSSKIFATHGHIYNKEHMPKLHGITYFISGHTHISGIDKQGDITFFNPGSCALPKDGKEPSVAIYEDGQLNIIGI